MYQQQQKEKDRDRVARLLEGEQLLAREKQLILSEWHRQHIEWARRVEALENRCQFLEQMMVIERRAFAEEMERLATRRCNDQGHKEDAQ
jgi:hypothetical protein